MQLKEYINIIRKRWWLALVVLVAAAAAAYLYSLAQPKIYETDVTVVGKTAKPDGGLDNSVKSALLRLQTTIPSPDMATRIDQRAKLDLGSDQILGKLKVKADPDNYTLKVTVSDTDPARAAKIANAIADTVHDDNLELQSSIPEDSRIFFDKIAAAGVPSKPSQPRTLLNTGAAAVLGLVVGLIFVFVVEFFDNNIRTEEDVEQFTGLSVLGVVPTWRPGNRANAPTVPAPAGNYGYAADSAADSSSDPASADNNEKTAKNNRNS